MIACAELVFVDELSGRVLLVKDFVSVISLWSLGMKS